jgi:hypothetical protein
VAASPWSREIGGISASGGECGAANAHRKPIELDGEVA